jgi:hypothetical protein
MLDMGRTVAFLPGLKRITHSTTATILLCQLLYWTKHTKDGWVYKTAEEWEEETGLTYYEQKTAKRDLLKMGLIERERKRLEHTTRYKINQSRLNELWEQSSDIVSIPEIEPDIEPDEEEEQVSEIAVEETIPVVEKEPVAPSVPTTPAHSSAVQKKGDLIDGMLATWNSPGGKKVQEKILIKSKIEKRLHIFADSRKWEEFIDFVWGRQTKHNEPIDIFINYAIKENFNPQYWTPEKMRTLWPQAFMNGSDSREEKERIDNFLEKLPERKEEVYAPMPKDIGRKRDL